MKCMVECCRADALPEPVGVGQLPLSEVCSTLVDLYACQDHRDWLVRETLAHVSISIQATPAVPRSS